MVVIIYLFMNLPKENLGHMIHVNLTSLAVSNHKKDSAQKLIQVHQPSTHAEPAQPLENHVSQLTNSQTLPLVITDLFPVLNRCKLKSIKTDLSPLVLMPCIFWIIKVVLSMPLMLVLKLIILSQLLDGDMINHSLLNIGSSETLGVNTGEKWDTFMLS